MSYNLANARLLPQWLYEESATKKVPLGTIFEMADGRKYAYARIGASAIASGGLVLSVLTTVGAHEDTVTVAHPVGTKVVTVTDAGATKNCYEDGYLIVTDGGGKGEIYKIRSNTVAASNLTQVTLYDGIATLWAIATTDVDLWANPYNGLVICPSSAVNAPVGVSLIPMTATYYGWVQIAGYGSVIIDVASAGGAELDENAVVCSRVTSGYGGITTTPANSDMAHVVGVLVPVADIGDATATLVKITLTTG